MSRTKFSVTCPNHTDCDEAEEMSWTKFLITCPNQIDCEEAVIEPRSNLQNPYYSVLCGTHRKWIIKNLFKEECTKT